MDEATRERLRALVEKFEGHARAAFRSADKQAPGDTFGRRFIEHGAMCYLNCASALSEALADPQTEADEHEGKSFLKNCATPPVVDVAAMVPRRRWPDRIDVGPVDYAGQALADGAPNASPLVIAAISEVARQIEQRSGPIWEALRKSTNVRGAL